MQIYCGTDIIEVERVKNAILSTPSFKEKIFTPSEIAYAESKKDVAKYQTYAGRFAAKEAVYKSVSHVFPHVLLNEIEIINEKEFLNRPTVIIHNKDILYYTGIISIDVSISHIKDYATAYAVTKIE